MAKIIKNFIGFVDIQRRNRIKRNFSTFNLSIFFTTFLFNTFNESFQISGFILLFGFITAETNLRLHILYSITAETYCAILFFTVLLLLKIFTAP